jgi:hypothetical protein
VVEDALNERPLYEDIFEENDPRLSYTIDRDANRIGGIVRLRNGTAQSTINVPEAGPHTLIVRAQRMINGTAAAPRMRVTVAGQNFDFDVPADMQDNTFSIELPAGAHGVLMQSLNFEENAAENRGNDIMFDNLIVRSNVLVEGPGRGRIMVCDPVADETSCAPTIIETFAKRAWRRPLSAEERATLNALYASVRGQGEDIEESIKLVLRGILASPKFLYRYRMIDDADSETLLDPFVLASRLSFFIWSSAPDDRLLSAAEDGTLSSPDGIRQTVTWMLADSRATALADGFAEQWLDLRHLDKATPSAEVYPEFNASVRDAMTRESKYFFLDYVTNKLPLATMLEPNFAYRNTVLAVHYGLPAMETEGFHRVEVGPGDRRGILSLSAWLTARSDSTHSSPIKRGSWIADNMLCAPVPPPPAGLEIGQLMEGNPDLTVRDQLELHRNDPACTGCHASLDVLGMGFQVFDGVGRFINDPALDSLGEIPGASSFRGADEFAGAMEPSQFVTCVSKRLFSYAIGRPLERKDLDAFEAINEPAVLTLTLPDLITAIALSPAFSQPTPLE